MVHEGRKSWTNNSRYVHYSVILHCHVYLSDKNNVFNREIKSYNIYTMRNIYLYYQVFNSIICNQKMCYNKANRYSEKTITNYVPCGMGYETKDYL